MAQTWTAEGRVIDRLSHPAVTSHAHSPGNSNVEEPMPMLAELYVATRTRNTANADTENLPVLVVKRGSDIVFTKPLFGGKFRTARGAGAVWASTSARSTSTRRTSTSKCGPVATMRGRPST